MNMLTVYDLVGQYIAYNGPIQEVQVSTVEHKPEPEPKPRQPQFDGIFTK